MMWREVGKSGRDLIVTRERKHNRGLIATLKMLQSNNTNIYICVLAFHHVFPTHLEERGQIMLVYMRRVIVSLFPDDVIRNW
jgi:hypothetical protein